MIREIQIGERVLYNYKLEGIVRFIGTTSSAKGIFYGIELNSPDGRTDGTMDGISYFKCHEKHGIFARRSQLSEIKSTVTNVIIQEKLLKSNDEHLDSISRNYTENEELDNQRQNNDQFQTDSSTTDLTNKATLEIKSRNLKFEKDFRRNTVCSNLKMIHNKHEIQVLSSIDLEKKEPTTKEILIQENIKEIQKKEKTLPNKDENACQLDTNSSFQSHRNLINFKLKPQISLKQNQSEVESMPTNMRIPKDFRRNTISVRAGNNEQEKENKLRNTFGKKESTAKSIENQYPLTIDEDPNEKQFHNNFTNEELSKNPISTQDMIPKIEINNENQRIKITNFKNPRRNTVASKPVHVESRLGKENQLMHPKNIGAIITNGVSTLDKDKEIKDLKEKNETLQILKKKEYKRCADLEKLNKELQKDLLEVKESKENICKEFDSYREMMKSAEEEIEMVTIDKEMAEERLDQVNQDYQKLKELYNHVLEENSILKNSEGSFDAITFIDQIAIINKYKNAIIELSQSINCIKEENRNLDAELGIMKELQIFQENESEQLKIKIDKYEKDLKEMKDLVDSTADVEVILEKLTFQNEYLEKELKKHSKRLMELDQLEDDRLAVIEVKDNKIREFHEECDCLNQIVNEIQNALDKNKMENNELIYANDQLNEKIRSLTTLIKEKESEILSQKEIIKKAKENVRELSNLTFSKQNIEKNEMKREIEYKLKSIELNQKSRQIQLMTKYLPASFSIPGGEQDLIQTVVIFDNFIDKISLILEYIIEKRRSYQKGNNSESFQENICIEYKLEFMLIIWRGLLKQLQINIHYCSQETLTQLSREYKQILQQEQNIDLLIDLMKKQCLDNCRNLSNVFQSIVFFQKFYTGRFFTQKVDCNLKMKNFISILNKGSECLRNDLSWISNIMGNNMCEQTKKLIDNLNKISTNMQSNMKNTQIFLRHNQAIEFDSALSKSMDDIIFSLMDIVQTVSDFALQVTDEGILSDEAMLRMMEIFSMRRNPSNPTSNIEILFVMNSIDKLAESIVVNFKSGMYDTDRINETLDSTIDINAASFRDKLMRLQTLPFEIKMKDEKLASINTELKNKSSHLSEAILQVNFFKQKYDTALETRENMIKQLNERISELEVNAKRHDVEKITELETEIMKLNRLNERLSNGSFSYETNLNDINGFQNEIHNLNIAVKYLMNKLHKSNATKSEKRLQELKPLNVQKVVSNYSINCQMRQAKSIHREIYKNLSEIKIPDLSSKNDIKRFSERAIQYSKLKNKGEKLMSDGMKICHRKYVNSAELMTTNCINNSIGVIRLNRNIENDLSMKCASIDHWSLKKLEELFC